MNPCSLTPAPTVSTSYFCSRQMGAAVFRGRTQEVLKPRGACYWLLRVLKDPGIESQVSPASLCAIRTPWPRGELERLLTTLKGSADRPQIGMGQARMRLPQPDRPFERAGAALGFCREGAHKDQAAFTDRTRAWEGYPGRDHTATTPAQVGPRGSDVALRTTTDPRWIWGFGSRGHPGSDRPPSCSLCSTSRAADLRTCRPRPATSVTAAAPRSKRSPAREQPILSRALL